MKPWACPVCNGSGMVSRPPEVAGDVPHDLTPRADPKNRWKRMMKWLRAKVQEGQE